MKTTVEIPDVLFERARAAAKQRGTSTRALIEDGLNHVLLSAGIDKPRPTLPDLSFGGPLGSVEMAASEMRSNREFEIINGELVKVSR